MFSNLVLLALAFRISPESCWSQTTRCCQWLWTHLTISPILWLSLLHGKRLFLWQGICHRLCHIWHTIKLSAYFTLLNSCNYRDFRKQLLKMSLFCRQCCPFLKQNTKPRRLEIKKRTTAIKMCDVEFVFGLFKLHQRLKQHTTKACGQLQKIQSVPAVRTNLEEGHMMMIGQL